MVNMSLSKLLTEMVNFIEIDEDGKEWRIKRDDD